MKPKNNLQLVLILVVITGVILSGLSGWLLYEDKKFQGFVNLAKEYKIS